MVMQAVQMGVAMQIFAPTIMATTSGMGLKPRLADRAKQIGSRSVTQALLDMKLDITVDSNLPLIVKPYISDNVMQICTDAVQVLGGYGYMKEYPVERYMREAKIFQIFGGTNQIKRKNLMKVLAGKDTGK